MIKNIIFDMGEVLIRFDRDLFIERAGVTDPADRELLKREVYLSVEWSMMDRGSITDEEASARMCARLPERLHEVAHRLVLMWDRPIIEIDGMYGLVEELKGMGYGIYLLSNASYHQHEYWDRIPASRFFDGTLVSADVKLVKPQPEIFFLAALTFGVRPEESFFIDDATPNVEAAMLCGFRGAVFHGDASELRRKLIEARVPVKP